MKGIQMRNSIVTKLGALCVLFILAPLVVGTAYAFYSYEKSVDEVATEYIMRTVEKAGDSIDQYIENTSEIMGAVYQQHSSFGFLFPNVLEYISPGATGINATHKGLVMKNFLESMIRYQPDYLYNAFIVEAGGDVYYASNPRMFSSRNPSYVFDGQAWFREIADSPSKRIQSRFVDSRISGFLFRPAKRDLLLFARNIYDVNASLRSGRVSATLFFCVDTAYFDTFFDIEEPGVHRFHIVDREGIIRYSTEKRMTGSLLSYHEALIADGNVRKSRSVSDNGGDYFICGRTIDSAEWMVVGETNRKLLISGFVRMQNSVLLIICCVLVVCAAAYWLLYKLTARPVGIIFRNMRRIEGGRLEGFLQIGSQDEFGAINSGLIDMAANLSDYIQRSYIAEIRRNAADLYALQSQVRPHFMMNALESIRMHLIAKDDTETARAVKLLGQILADRLSDPVSTVTLGEEVTFLQRYVEFQKYRFGERVKLELDVPEDCRAIPMQKMLVQPVVENCFKHGFAQMESGAVVVVSAYLAGGALRLIIMDNGCGMDSRRLEELQGQLRGEDRGPEYGHIGLINVNNRIRSRHGASYGLEVTSMPGQGTIVEMRLPDLRREENGGADPSDHRG